MFEHGTRFKAPMAKLKPNCSYRKELKLYHLSEYDSQPLLTFQESWVLNNPKHRQKSCLVAIKPDYDAVKYRFKSNIQ